MKTKIAKHPKQAKATVQLKDLKPKKDAKGGNKTFPGFIGGVQVASGDVN